MGARIQRPISHEPGNGCQPSPLSLPRSSFPVFHRSLFSLSKPCGDWPIYTGLVLWTLLACQNREVRSDLSFVIPNKENNGQGRHYSGLLFKGISGQTLVVPRNNTRGPIAPPVGGLSLLQSPLVLLLNTKAQLLAF